jgi:hypothetical protein
VGPGYAMPNYGVSDVERILRAREWRDWDEMIKWLERQPANDPTRGMSAEDRNDLLRDLRRARDAGEPLVRDPGDLYRALMALASPGG